MKKLWKTESDSTDHETANEIEKKVESFTVGNDYRLDQHLIPYDLEASAVHVMQLKKAGYLNDEETNRLMEGFQQILQLWENDEFQIALEEEDGHTAIENWLTENLGEVGRKVHTGRSRNDQVLTALRMYEREQLGTLVEKTVSLAEAFLDTAEEHKEVPMPGYTHSRKAMLSSVAQWLGGYTEMLTMQLESSKGVESLIQRCPLGTAAGFGSSIEIDRDREAELLRFNQPIVCASTAQMSRGWVELQLVQFLAGLTFILSRFSGDLIRFSSDAYGFIKLDPQLCTGSSIMPNKSNPDMAELVRGKHALLNGYAATIQSIIQPLGSGYHRDLQLTKEPVIRSFEITDSLLDATGLLIAGMTIREQELADACTPDLLAAEEAYKRVKEEGVSFREAYRKVKENGAGLQVGKPTEMLEIYSQLGSPGNSGLERLRNQLRDLASC